MQLKMPLFTSFNTTLTNIARHDPSGGPGTGKLTHCDKLAENDLNLVHINMGNTFLNIANEYGKNASVFSY